MDSPISVACREDALEIMRLINSAYDVETGNDGISFKNTVRLVDPLECDMGNAYEEGRILKIVDPTNKKIAGVIYYDLRGDSVYFGPFAVDSSYSGKGIGSQLLNELEAIGRKHQKIYLQMRVVNHRTDLFPFYEKRGFQRYGEAPYPDPSRLTRPSFFYLYRKEISYQI